MTAMFRRRLQLRFLRRRFAMSIRRALDRL